MDNFAEAIAAIKDLKEEGLISEYAIGGAMALTFWSEPIPTFDLDVFVLMENPGPLVSLDGIYEWARRRGFRESAEHIIVAGVPVQFIPAPNELAEEAIRNAEALDYDGQSVQVIQPEYLIALYLEPSARTTRRLLRAAALLEEAELDRKLLDDLLRRYNLELPNP